MPSNITRFEADLEALIKSGNQLEQAMIYECDRGAYKTAAKKAVGDGAEEHIKAIPSFRAEYQSWYSESLVLLKQLLPGRQADFIRHYEKPRTRKSIDYENYRIEDYLQRLQVTRAGEVVVDRSAAFPHFQQQLAIVKACKARFKSSLFEIRQLVQADLLDSEIESAEILAKHKFTRAAGAVAGVVLERHLGQVCIDHNISTGKKNPSISDFSEALKSASVIDLPQWRFIQHLADIRNLCDHSRKPEPTVDQVEDLLQGAKKITKTIY